MSRTDLRDKVENALNETRMLILGAQVLIGFQYQGVFQPGFERLPPSSQVLRLAALGLMLITVGFLLTPGAYHRIVENGHDSDQLTTFTGRIASLALLPFAVAIGLDVYLASSTVLDTRLAVPFGIAASAIALLMWYGLEWVMRLRGDTPRASKEMPRQTDLSTRIKQVLTEARVVLPGAQALLGFQFAAVLTDGFAQLEQSSQYVHLVCLGLIGLSIVFLMAPAAFHRIVERGEDTERMHAFASVMVLAAMVPLALGIAGDFYVVLDKVLKSQSLAILLAGASVLFFFGLWFGLTTALRGRRQTEAATRPAR